VGQSSAPPHHFGGASVDSTSGQAAGQGWESGGGEATQPSAPAGTTGQAEWAAAEVGVLPTPVAWWGLDAKVRAQLRELTRRQGTCHHASSRCKGAGAGPQGLATPARIRPLQETRSRKAKAQPTGRFDSLYGAICREDILAFALRLVVANDGAPGVDGASLDSITVHPPTQQGGRAARTIRTRSCIPAMAWGRSP
jgi:hypothetical protein